MAPEPCIPSSGKTYIDDMLNMKDQSNIDSGISDVTEFYDGCNVLLTGGSGFIGKLLVEKLLRTCSSMGKLYMLLRAKKGKTPAQRFKEQLEDPLYDRLRREQPNFADKVVIIEGDTGEKNLGLSSTARDFLVKNTHIVFHGAATVRFDESLRKVVNINVRGVKLMLLLAKEMKNLKAFVHVSTAYSHCNLDYIEEKYYKPAMDPDKAISMVDMLDDEVLQHITPRVIGSWPNTYAFSKAVGEDVVRLYSRGLPTCIVRPSIVLSTMKEPVAGWSDNLYGATGVSVGAYVCLLRVLHCEAEKTAEMIPADFVINNVIVAAWDVNKLWNEKKMAIEPVGRSDLEVSQPPIYNCVSSCQKPLTWNDFMHLNYINGIDVPSRLTLWYHVFILTKYKWFYNFAILFLHLIPAIIVDNLARLTGRKPMLLRTYQKIHKFSGVIAYFCTKQWKFNNDNVLRLWKRTSLTDQKKFDFNVKNLDWNDYFLYHIRGIRVYLLKDPMSTVEQGRAKYKLLNAVCGWLHSLRYFDVRSSAETVNVSWSIL
ncbi:fatty acyl-CoA reductase wat-like [Nasonia vitripennis]|uniref:Fatty acyl-CoA reductase n=1 Tax=Nasonia vitripennis TaxID=7425 RepID=A0A7M7T653_NASVI|nr:fatty acyl-CoA reductase wat-like [Nasonia vitripennis]